MEKITSKKGTLQKRDFRQSLIAIGIGAISSTAYELLNLALTNSITSGLIEIDVMFILKTSILTGVVQMLRKLSQNSDGKFLGKDK